MLNLYYGTGVRNAFELRVALLRIKLRFKPAVLLFPLSLICCMKQFEIRPE